MSAGVPPKDAGTFRGLLAKARSRAKLGIVFACKSVRLLRKKELEFQRFDNPKP